MTQPPTNTLYIYTDKIAIIRIIIDRECDPCIPMSIMMLSNENYSYSFRLSFLSFVLFCFVFLTLFCKHLLWWSLYTHLCEYVKFDINVPIYTGIHTNTYLKLNVSNQMLFLTIATDVIYL